MKNRNSNNIKIGLFGSSGKMGQAIEQVSKQRKDVIPFLAVGKSPSNVFSISVEKIDGTESEILEDVDAWIDFTSGTGLFDLLKQTKKQNTPVVSGSTGLSEKDFSHLRKLSCARAIFWSSNMSLGMWSFRQAMKSFNLIPDFDFAIDEIHHSHKKDRPSGTAKTLHADLEKIVGKKIEAPSSHRLGGIYGVHTLIAASGSEVITFQHQALNRGVFAEGAIMAAVWLAKKKSGLYSMEHLFSKKGD